MNKEKEVEYEKIENIKPENKPLLISDLTDRTGLNIVEVDVVSISFLKDTAVLRLHYRSEILPSSGSMARKITSQNTQDNQHVKSDFNQEMDIRSNG